MRTKRLGWTVVVGLLALAVGAQAEGGLRLGAGVNYWRTLKNIDVQHVDQDGFSYVATCQYRPGWIGVEADVEWLKKGFGGSTQDVYEPQAYLVVGKAIYGAVGIGGYYTDGDFSSKTFYAFRAGLDLEILPVLHLDINANYRFEDWSTLSGSNINTDTIFLGAAARLAF
ncbi:MAG: hypothetical protein NTV49_03185 [Kiritimatiellaeota bacterium]|nr:hypothetical protein [Kiritimatiellota bacterium]